MRRMLPGPALLAENRHAAGQRQHSRPEIPGCGEHDGASGRENAGAECHRRGQCSSTDKPIPFEAYAENRALGGFIVIDKMTNATVGAGMINFSLRRSQNVHWQALDVSRETHAKLKNQQSAVLWFTGLSGAGKSTIANLVEKKLVRMNRHTFLLDGDNVRHGLNKDLGFTDTDRIENIRRVGEVAKLMTDAGSHRRHRLHLALPFGA